MRDGGGYAFPHERPCPEKGHGATAWNSGMTMRQWYKGQAMQGLLAGKSVEAGGDLEKWVETFVVSSALLADAQIAEDKKAREDGASHGGGKSTGEAEGGGSEMPAPSECPGCGNFFEPGSPGETKCAGCLREDAEEAHDAGECVENCPICVEERRGSER